MPSASNLSSFFHSKFSLLRPFLFAFSNLLSSFQKTPASEKSQPSQKKTFSLFQFEIDSSSFSLFCLFLASLESSLIPISSRKILIKVLKSGARVATKKSKKSFRIKKNSSDGQFFFEKCLERMTLSPTGWWTRTTTSTAAATLSCSWWESPPHWSRCPSTWPRLSSSSATRWAAQTWGGCSPTEWWPRPVAAPSLGSSLATYRKWSVWQSAHFRQRFARFTSFWRALPCFKSFCSTTRWS